MSCSNVLRDQLTATYGNGFITRISARYAGSYQWTVNIDITGVAGNNGETLQVKFGPSDWYANEADTHWHRTVDPADTDYSHVFLTRPAAREVWPSAVTLSEVLDGLSGEDRRLHDEIVDLLGPADTSHRASED